jgi:hypothetical protein
MKPSSHNLNLCRWVRAIGLGLCALVTPAVRAASPCDQIRLRPKNWVTANVNAFVFAAYRAYQSDSAVTRYQRILDGISGTVQKCRLGQDKDFVARYPEFIDYINTVSLERLPDHELGFLATDSSYFADTRDLVAIPDYLLTPEFLRVVSRRETLKQAKGMLRDLNQRRTADDQLAFFSYESRHLGTPDNPDSFYRLLILVPGNAAKGVPEKWVQFGIPERGARGSVRNVSVVAVMPGPNGTTNTYFKDYFRTFHRNGSITIKGRWELGEGDENCAVCHKSGVLPVFPAVGSVSADEQPVLTLVNERFLKYSQPRFDKYLNASRLGPGLGSALNGERGAGLAATMRCGNCHQPFGLGALNWPMDRTLISSFVKGGQMPLGFTLTPAERNRLYRGLIEEYFSIDESRPGILKTWLLGQQRKG